jgi:hypothetical protein
MKRFFLKAMVAGVVVILGSSAAVRGAVLYQDTASASGQVMNLGNNQQFGQQVWLGSWVPHYLTNFSFEYYSPFTTYSGSVQMDVRLYQNNGTLFNGYASPGSIFYDSGNFTLANPWSISGTNTATVVFQLSDLLSGNTVNLNPNFILPTNFTFTVSVSGLQGGDQVGLPIFGAPSVGTNSLDYWYNVGGNWQLLTNSQYNVSFGAQFMGTPTPEPSVIYLGAMGAVALTIMIRRRQQRG